MSNFENFVGAQAHQEEIKNSRVGGMGGSDAAILYRIGMNGLSAVTATDSQRLAVMLGMSEQPNWGGNKYTEAGHQFEDEVAVKFEDVAGAIIGEDSHDWQREVLMEQPLARNFRTFAHADFHVATKLGAVVIECKYVQKSTEATAAEYAAQLQWYYLMGAARVALMHGWGGVDPLKIEGIEPVIIERDERTIETLRMGISTLDEAISAGWRPQNADKAAIDDVPPMVADAYLTLATAKECIKEAEAAAKEAAGIVRDYMEQFGLFGIMATDAEGHKTAVTYTAASETRTFDAAKFLAEHPEYDTPEYYKVSKRAASVTYKGASTKGKA